MLTGWRDGFLRCFDVVQRAQIWEIANAHRGSITTVYADQNYILTGGEDGAVRVWSRNAHKLLTQFNGKTPHYLTEFRLKKRHSRIVP